jgi:putative thioredoxin
MVTDSPHIADVTLESFDQAVLENSHRLPVLVDFWADWCAPCKMQLPALLKLAQEYGGRFLLAKVNTDAERTLAERNGIRSLPTLRLYRNGQAVEELLGAQPESTLRALLDRYIERASDRTRAQARAAFEQGRRQEALTLLREARAEDPGNHRLTLDYARLCLSEGELEECESALSGLPPELRNGPETAAIESSLLFAHALVAAPEQESLESALRSNPGDSAARYQLAARQVLDQDYDRALENLMELLRRDPAYGDQSARKGLLALFQVLGDEDERVPRYRRQMFNLLH